MADLTVGAANNPYYVQLPNGSIVDAKKISDISEDKKQGNAASTLFALNAISPNPALAQAGMIESTKGNSLFCTAKYNGKDVRYDKPSCDTLREAFMKANQQ